MKAEGCHWLLLCQPQDRACQMTPEEMYQPRSTGCILTRRVSYCPICFSERGQCQGAGGTGSLQDWVNAQQGCCENSMRTRASNTDASYVIAFDPISSLPYLSSCLLQPSSPLCKLSNGFHHPLILFAVFLFAKSLSFKNCNGVWGEEALDNYASGFYVCDGGIDHIREDVPSFFFFL